MRGTLIRRGNHFIRMGGSWGLIGGPWFEELERLRNGGFMPMRIPSMASQQIKFMASLNAYPSSYQEEYVEWEPRRYHPGYYKWVGSGPIYKRWMRWNNRRLRVAYRLLPDGKIPPLFNSATLPEDESQRDYILWNMR